MSARIAECQRRIDGAFDLQQAIKHRVFRTHVQRVILQPLLAARAAARRRARNPQTESFFWRTESRHVRGRGHARRAGQTYSPAMSPYSRRFPYRSCTAFPIKPSTSLPYAVPSGISIRGLLAAYSQCAPAARKSAGGIHHGMGQEMLIVAFRKIKTLQRATGFVTRIG